MMLGSLAQQVACEQRAAEAPPAPRALAALFPEAPAWALAPFLGEAYLEIPARGYPRRHHITADIPFYHPPAADLLMGAAPPTGAPPHSHHAWLIRVSDTQGSARPMTAVFMLQGEIVPFPFGGGVAVLRPNSLEWDDSPAGQASDVPPPVMLPGDRAVGAQWSLLAGQLLRPSARRDEARRALGKADILRRWQAIPDAAVRAEITAFWLGHSLPDLAELGLATLQLTAPELARKVIP